VKQTVYGDSMSSPPSPKITDSAQIIPPDQSYNTLATVEVVVVTFNSIVDHRVEEFHMLAKHKCAVDNYARTVLSIFKLEYKRHKREILK